MGSNTILFFDEIEDCDWHPCVVIEGDGNLRSATSRGAAGDLLFEVMDTILVKRIDDPPGWFAAKIGDELGFIMASEVVFFPEI